MHGKPEDTSGKAAVDPEAFARNLARLMDEGGRAMAAYMKPREQGTVQDEVAEELAEVTCDDLCTLRPYFAVRSLSQSNRQEEQNACAVTALRI